MFLLVPAYQVVLDRRPLNGCVCVFHKKWQQTQILSNLEGFSNFFALEDSVKHYCQKTSD